MKQVFKFFKCNVLTLGKLKIINYECHVNEVNQRVYVLISPIYKLIPHKFYIEDLIDDDKIIMRLEFKSIKYLFSVYGILNSQTKNNFFTLAEIVYEINSIRVRNITNLKFEIWDKLNFETNFMLLDKKSLKEASEYFVGITNHVIDI